MLAADQFDPGKATRHLGANTFAFAVCVAVWTIFSVIGVQIQKELGLNDSQLGLLLATPILTGSVSRFFLGMLTEQFGGRPVFTIVMLASAGSTWLLAAGDSFALYLLAGLGVGLAGGSFIVGIAYTSEWFDKKRQGMALGVFGAGNIGAAVTNFAAPFLVVAMGWEGTARLYAVVLGVTAIVYFLVTEPDPRIRKRHEEGGRATPLATQLAPLKKIQVWRFGLYYFFVFGGFVALASWLPRYYTGNYGLGLEAAGMLAAAYSLPASALRALGGVLADRLGARTVMYVVFIASLFLLLILSYPETEYRVQGIDGSIEFSFGMPVWGFVLVTVVLGFFMSLGSAAVYKHIPVYYPDHVGTVGGLVGMIGGLGGFFMPLAFGVLNDVLNVWTSCFMLMFVLVVVSLTWMHFAIRRMERRRFPELERDERQQYLPELQPDYRPEDPK